MSLTVKLDNVSQSEVYEIYPIVIPNHEHTIMFTCNVSHEPSISYIELVHTTFDTIMTANCKSNKKASYIIGVFIRHDIKKIQTEVLATDADISKPSYVNDKKIMSEIVQTFDDIGIHYSPIILEINIIKNVINSYSVESTISDNRFNC